MGLAQERVVTIVEIDVETHVDLAETHGVQRIPLLKYMVDGGKRSAWESLGVVSREEIINSLSIP
tara:strand:+ start:1724 stop:1918 length:195 start_codon:yes stop_codon:yes gene_type:complete